MPVLYCYNGNCEVLVILLLWIHSVLLQSLLFQSKKVRDYCVLQLFQAFIKRRLSIPQLNVPVFLVFSSRFLYWISLDRCNSSQIDSLMLYCNLQLLLPTFLISILLMPCCNNSFRLMDLSLPQSRSALMLHLIDQVLSGIDQQNL